jgi:hypothetical protein
VSAIGHLVVVGAFVALALWGMLDRTTVHVVNLFPSIAAVGTPAGSPLRCRPVRPPPPAPDARTRARAEAARGGEAGGSLSALAHGDAQGRRARPPTLGMPSDRRGKAAVERRRVRPRRPSGSRQAPWAGQGSMTLDVTDFPHAWYLRQVLQKVEERWQTQNRPNEPGQKPRIYVEIQRDGTIAAPRIEQSSGSSFYGPRGLARHFGGEPIPAPSRRLEQTRSPGAVQLRAQARMTRPHNLGRSIAAGAALLTLVLGGSPSFAPSRPARKAPTSSSMCGPGR